MAWDEWWDDLSSDQQHAWTILGWDQVTWDTSSQNQEQSFCWKDGNLDQLNAAQTLCYNEQSWNDMMLLEYGIQCNN